MEGVMDYVEKNPITVVVIGIFLIIFLVIMRIVMRVVELYSMKVDFSGVPPMTDARLVRDRFSTEKVKEMDRIDAIFVGSGMGSLTCAALLARTGRRVLVLEQHDRAGGATHAFSELGWEWDVGVHYIGDRVWKKSSPTRAGFDAVTCGALDWRKMAMPYDVAILTGSGDGSVPEEATVEGPGAFVGTPSDYVFPMIDGTQNLVNAIKSKFSTRLHPAIDKWLLRIRKSRAASKPFWVARLLPTWMYNLFAGFLEAKLLSTSATETVEQALHAVGLGPAEGETVEEKEERERLRWLLTYHAGDYGLPADKAAFIIQGAVTHHYLEGAGYPIGGAEMIARGACRTIRACGGRVLVNSRVKQLRIARKSGTMTCTGVELADGTVISAPLIVSGAGAPITYGKLLDRSIAKSMPALHEAVEAFGSMDKDVKPSVCHLQLFVGIDGDCETPDSNYWLYLTKLEKVQAAEKGTLAADDVYESKDPRDVPEELKTLPFPIWGCFISFPSAKTPEPRKPCAIVIAEAPWDAFDKWANTKYKKRPADYKEVKEQLQQGLLAVFKSRFPGLADRIKYVDLGTPLSAQHYLEAPHGASYGLEHNPARFRLARHLRPQTVVQNLYLTGQDVLMCGVSGAMMGGFFTAAAISPFEIIPRFGDVLGLWRNKDDSGEGKKVV